VDLQNRGKVKVADQRQGRADTPGFTAGTIMMGSRSPRLAYRLSREKHDEMREARLSCAGFFVSWEINRLKEICRLLSNNSRSSDSPLMSITSGVDPADY
jgi:hypothetical protein